MLSKKQIKAYLPHREPFLFVDDVSDFSLPPGKKLKDITTKEDVLGCEITSRFHVGKDHDIFRGHFPSNPVLPGVIQIEMMAQTAGLTLYYCCRDPENVNIKMSLLSIRNAKFRSPVLPGTDLFIKAKLIRVRGSMVSHECKIFDTFDKPISEAETLALIEIEP